MNSIVRAWVLAYKFADHYNSESSWKIDFDLFKANLKIFRAANDHAN